MIPTPYRFEADLTDDEFQKIGQMTLRWSHIEHSIANSLKQLLELDDEEAIIMVFPLSFDAKMNKIRELAEIKTLSKNSQTLLTEMTPLARGVQFIRNSVVHSIVVKNDKDEDVFNLRNKRRYLTKTEVFGCEDFTNYACHVSQAFRLSLGGKDDDRGHEYALPDRPAVPLFLPKDCQLPPK